MRWYAERPGRLVAQVGADVATLAWVVAAVLAGVAVREALHGLRGPATALSDAGGRIRDAFAGAADTAGSVPLFGDDLAVALAPGSDAGSGLASAGRGYADTIGTVANLSAVLVPLALALPVLVVWLALRLRYARRAGAAADARDGAPDLLALRALTGAPVRRVRGVAPDPVGAWRDGDPDTVRRLAAVELAALGLRAPH